MRKHIETTLFALLVAALFGAAAWGGIALTRELGRVAAIWPCNGLLVSLLLLRSRSDWPAMVAACFAANVAVNTLVGDSLIASFGFSTANLGEVLLAAVALRPHLNSMSALLNARVLIRFFCYAVLLAPAASGIAASLVLHAATGSPLLDTFSRWWAADALGMAMMVPLVFAVQPCELRDSLRGQRWPGLLLPFALLLLITCGVFAQNTYPLLFLIVPAVLLIAFRLGFTATAIAIFMTAVIAVAFTIAGKGPFMLVHGPGMTGRILAIQLLIGVLVLTTYPVCAVIVNQRALLRNLAASEERFRMIAVNSSDMIVMTDRHGAYVYLSPAATTMFGWSPEEVLGQDGLAYIHPEDVALYAHGLELLRRGRPILSGSFRVRHRDGHYVWVETISRLLTDPVTGEMTGWVSNTRDISARKRVEQLKDEFISTVNHELRTPLTAILGSIGLATSGKFGVPEPRLQRLLEITKENGNRLAQLVNDILDFEKVSSGKMRFELQSHSVDELIDRSVAAMQPYAERLRIALVARHRVPGSMITVDSSRFQQIMANLLSNAAKFSRGGSTVEIDASVLRGRCRISVIDHGCGIPARFQKELFDRFSQADAADDRQRGGTGLGMAIAKQLTEKMSGSITFESQENVGTTFHLDFAVAFSRAHAVA